MNIADELQKLDELHRSGTLSDEEFARAKAAVLGAGPQPPPGGQVPPPAQAIPPPARSPEEQTRQWSMFVHLSQLAGFVMPVAGLALPIVLWQIKKQELPGIDVHGKIVVNWIISEIIYLVACFVLSFLIVGIPLLIAVIVCGIVFPIVGGIKASNGEVWEYPLAIKFLK